MSLIGNFYDKQFPFKKEMLHLCNPRIRFYPEYSSVDLDLNFINSNFFYEISTKHISVRVSSWGRFVAEFEKGMFFDIPPGILMGNTLRISLTDSQIRALQQIQASELRIEIHLVFSHKRRDKEEVQLSSPCFFQKVEEERKSGSKRK